MESLIVWMMIMLTVVAALAVISCSSSSLRCSIETQSVDD